MVLGTVTFLAIRLTSRGSWSSSKAIPKPLLLELLIAEVLGSTFNDELINYLKINKCEEI
jgi:hypothetical protein